MTFFKNNKIQLKKPFFLLLGFTLYPLLIFFGLAGYFLEEHHFQKNVTNDLQSVSRLVDHQAELHVSELRSLLNHYAQDPLLQKAFLSLSREELYKTARPHFLANLDQDISHFYFINLDKTCFLRVHNPEQHGDLIDRYTTEEAARTDHLTAGLEMGPYGTFTLRAVLPWHINGELVGYIELGRDIKNLTAKIKEILDLELFVLINKKHLDRQKWHEGLWMTGQAGDWDEEPKHVIFDRTMPGLPGELAKQLALPHTAKEDLLFRVAIAGRNYQGGFLPLRDARGKELGEIIALRDRTDELSLRTRGILFVVGSAGVGLLIFALFYAYGSSLENHLRRTYTELTTEIATRQDVEKKLRKREEELELLIQDRTTQLEQTTTQLQQELQDHIKIAEELLKAQRLEAIGILAGGIAHDFNNLLTIILGNINLVSLDKKLSADCQTFLQEAERATRQAATLTNQLITFSDGGRAYTVVIADLGPLLKRVVADRLPPTVTCRYDIPADLWAVKADVKQLEQVIANLVDNACTAMNNQGMLEISCRNQKNGNHKELALPPLKFVQIAIKDNGCGIAEKNLSKIFDPYFSAKAKSSAKGSGLGLAVVHSIITKHGGFIRVESQEGKGAIFTISLPAAGNTEAS